MTNATNSHRAPTVLPTPYASASRLLGDAAELLLRWEMFTFSTTPDPTAAEALRRATRELCEEILSSGVASARVVHEATPTPIEPEQVRPHAVRTAPVDTSNACGVTLIDGGPAGRPGPWISFQTIRVGTLDQTLTNHLRPDVAINLSAWLFAMCAQAAAPAAAAAITSNQPRPRSIGDTFASMIEAICR